MKRKVIQLGYVTPNIETALDHWVGMVGAGPFYYADYEPEQQTHRGQPTHIRFRVAYGYSGDTQIELIQQLSGTGSAYTEALESAKVIPAGGLFHHLLVVHDGYDKLYQEYIAAGAVRSYDAVVPGVGRFCYLDARHLAGSYIELVEDTTGFEVACTKMRDIHLAWDGKNPRRNFDEIIAML